MNQEHQELVLEIPVSTEPAHIRHGKKEHCQGRARRIDDLLAACQFSWRVRLFKEKLKNSILIDLEEIRRISLDFLMKIISVKWLYYENNKVSCGDLLPLVGKNPDCRRNLQRQKHRMRNGIL